MQHKYRGYYKTLDKVHEKTERVCLLTTYFVLSTDALLLCFHSPPKKYPLV